MKKLLSLLAFVVTALPGFSQSQGVSQRATNGIAFGEMVVNNHINATNSSTTNTFAGKFQQGIGSLSLGSSSAAMGLRNVAVATGSFVTGLSNRAGSGAVGSFASGNNNSVAAPYSFVAGANNNADGSNVFVAGFDILMDTLANNSFLAGQHIAVLSGASNNFAWNGDPATTLIIPDTRTNAFTVNAPGGIFLNGVQFTNGSGSGAATGMKTNQFTTNAIGSAIVGNVNLGGATNNATGDFGVNGTFGTASANAGALAVSGNATVNGTLSSSTSTSGVFTVTGSIVSTITNQYPYFDSNGVMRGTNSGSGFTNLTLTGLGTISATNLWNPSNVKWWGAVGDGVASEDVAFSNTVAAAAIGGLIYIPAGTYLLTNSWQISKSVFIQGEGSAIAGATKINPAASFPAGSNFISITSQYSSVRDIKSDMQRRGGNWLTFIGEGGIFNIEGNFVVGVASNYWGIELRDPAGVNGICCVQIDRNLFADFDGGGIWGNGGGDSVNITRNVMQLVGSTSHILKWDGRAGAACLNFSMNNATGARKFITLSNASQFKILNNQFEATLPVTNSTSSMIEVIGPAAGGAIENNNLNGHSNSTNAIYFNDAQDILVLNNVISLVTNDVKTTSSTARITYEKGVEVGNVSDAGAKIFTVYPVSVSQHTNLVWDDTNARLGIGTTTPGSKLHVRDTSGSAASFIVGGASKGLRVGVGGTGAALEFVDSTGFSSYQPGFIYGSTLSLGHSGTNDLSITATGNVGIGVASPNDKFEVLGGIKFGTGSFSAGAGKLYTSATLGSVLTANTGSTYDMYLASAAGNALFANPTGTSVVALGLNGNVGIGTASPANILSVVGNVGVSGYITSTNGILWQGGGQMTNSYTATATLDFANLAAIGCEDLTITCTGAATGDAVSLGVPNASVVNNGTFTAWVSAADTVSVRFCTVVSGDPPSGTFRVQVNKWK